MSHGLPLAQPGRHDDLPDPDDALPPLPLADPDAAFDEGAQEHRAAYAWLDCRASMFSGRGWPPPHGPGRANPGAKVRPPKLGGQRPLEGRKPPNADEARL
jgi:hypothetical protein